MFGDYYIISLFILTILCTRSLGFIYYSLQVSTLKEHLSCFPYPKLLITNTALCFYEFSFSRFHMEAIPYITTDWWHLPEANKCSCPVLKFGLVACPMTSALWTVQDKLWILKLFRFSLLFYFCCCYCFKGENDAPSSFL